MIIVDASVAMKWFVAEDGHIEARRLQAVFTRLAAPDFLLIEVANIAWKKARRGELPLATASAIVTDLRASPLRLIEAGTLIEAALALSLEIDHPVYDCLYLAAAVQLDGVCLTADQRLIAKAGTTRLAGRARALSSAEAVLADLG